MIFFFSSPTVASCCRVKYPCANLSGPAARGTAGSAPRSLAAGRLTVRYPTALRLRGGTNGACPGPPLPAGQRGAARSEERPGGSPLWPPPPAPPCVARGSEPGCRRRRGGLGRGPGQGFLSPPPPPPLAAGSREAASAAAAAGGPAGDAAAAALPSAGVRAGAGGGRSSPGGGTR